MGGSSHSSIAVPCQAGAAATAGPEVSIRTTSHGIPHIVAGDWRSLGHGYGYALARDNICIVADSYLTVSARRSRWHGPDRGWHFGGNGTNVNNLNSDFFFQRIIDERTVEKLLRRRPPHGPSAAIRKAVRGYVSGYNRYLRERGGAKGVPDPACRGEGWVRPIKEIEAYRRFYQLALLASSGVAIDGIGGAQPPTPPLELPGISQGAGPTAAPRGLELPEPGVVDPGQPPPDEVAESLAEKLPIGGIGSNAYGLGRRATKNGHGMVLANPHFPWRGSERFYQAHVKIPGKIDASGASLMGVPVILIGHTRRMAWSHTVSTAFRFTPFEVTLVPGFPTHYLYDGQIRRMEEDEVTVPVRTAEGIERRSRTLYSTHHGPVFNELMGLPLFPWTPIKAWAMGDANAANFRYLNHFFETNRAQSVRELDRILRRNQGIPWVNTIAADRRGDAYYADISVVPHVDDRKAVLCAGALGVVTYNLLGLPTLDGSRSACEWGSDPDARQPGTFGPSSMPSLRRRDWVANSNDSYWLSHPDQPLEGYARIIGDERTERTLRTRSGIQIVQERLAGTDRMKGRKFRIGQLQRAVFENRQPAGELLRDELVELCRDMPLMPSTTAGLVDVSEACDVLERWNLRDDLDSPGALLFRRFVTRLLAQPVPLVDSPLTYAKPFDPSDPVGTPRGLNRANPLALAALGDAVDELRRCETPLDAGLRGNQFVRRGKREIPIHGGPGGLGVFNAISLSWDGCKYVDVPHGSSFVMATSFTPKARCPVDDRSILTYSQTTNRRSKHATDQTLMFSRKKWNRLPYCEHEIRADPKLRVKRIGGGFNPTARRSR